MSSKIKSDAEETLTDAQQEMKDQFIQIRDQIVAYAKENPMMTAGMALLAGVAIAQILRPRK